MRRLPCGPSPNKLRAPLVPPVVLQASVLLHVLFLPTPNLTILGPNLPGYLLFVWFGLGISCCVDLFLIFQTFQ